MQNSIKKVVAAGLAVGAAGTSQAATIAVSVPAAVSDGINTSAVVTAVGAMGAGIIGVVVAIKVIKWLQAAII